MMGRIKDVYHAKLGEVDDVPRMGMDYMFVSERGVTSKAEENMENIGDSITMLVLKDFWHKSIWIYPVEGKGVTKSEWLSHMIKEDLSTCGMDSCMLVVKSDQEPAIKEVQEDIAQRRRETGAIGTILEN